MQRPATLTGQDIGEAEGAVSALLDQVLAGTGTGITRHEYIVMRVLTFRAPFETPAALHDYLVEQRQLALDPPAAAALLGGMEAKGLISGSTLDSPGPTQMTAEGAALHTKLSEDVAKATARLYADFDPDDLATAHRVLNHVKERAAQLGGEL
jgi:DNA-binding MarR family transcriptional regulator